MYKKVDILRKVVIIMIKESETSLETCAPGFLYWLPGAFYLELYMPEWLAGAVDVVGKLFGTGYNLYTNQRDYDYQRALQQQIFEREDTAVQRRMADLKAAGLNPNLAAGSAAQAGAVVSRSSTNDLNIGSMLDTVMAANQVKMQKQQTDNAKIENQILENQKTVTSNEAAKSLLDMAFLTGKNVDLYPTFKNGDMKWNFDWPSKSKKLKDTPYYNQREQEMFKLIHDTTYADNAAKYMENQLKWSNVDHVIDNLSKGSKALIPWTR